MADSAHPTDVHVGARIRLRRKGLGVSQQALAQSLGLTFQQVQKYERGSNRVSASKLQTIARALDTTVEYFFQGLEGEPTTGVGRPNGPVETFLSTPDGYELASLFSQLSPLLRRRFLGLARALVSPADEAGPV